MDSSPISTQNSICFPISTASLAGFSQERVSNDSKFVENDYICLNCKMLANQPVLCSECEAIFCKPCFSKCTLCYGAASKDLTKKEIKIYEKICIKCSNYSYGCQEEDTIKNILQHEKDCNFSLYQCKYCKEKMFKPKTSGHKDTCTSFQHPRSFQQIPPRMESDSNNCNASTLNNENIHKILTLMTKLLQENTRTVQTLKQQLDSIETNVKQQVINIASIETDLKDVKDEVRKTARMVASGKQVLEDDKKLTHNLKESFLRPLLHSTLSREVQDDLEWLKDLEETPKFQEAIINYYNGNRKDKNFNKSLDLSSLNTKDTALKILKSPEFSNCEKLNLSKNNILPTGFKHLVGFNCLNNLKSLDISKNQIGDEGLEYLLQCSFVKTLTILDLSFNNISFNGLVKILKTDKLKNLTSLKVNIETSQGVYQIHEFSSINDLKSLLVLDLGWDQNLSTPNTFTIDSNNKKHLTVRGNTCFTHFVIDRVFTNEDFQVMIEVHGKQQSHNRLEVGIYNSAFDPKTQCRCSSHQNLWYLRCNGNFYINGNATNVSKYEWNDQKVVIGMKVYLSKKKMIFFLPERNLESQLYDLTGDNFRLFGSTCNTSTGTMKIIECLSLKQ